MPLAARKLRGPQLYSADDIKQLEWAAKLARQHLDEMLSHCVVGERPHKLAQSLDAVARRGGHETPMVSIENEKGDIFNEPCAVCVDDWVAHAKPPEQPLKRGQLVTIDLMIALDGWHADVADTIVVGGGGHRLLDVLDAVWAAGLAAIGPGVAWSEVALAMNSTAESNGAKMVRGLAGHGIGLAPHELPILPLVPGPFDPPVILRPGMVLTIEPVITSGCGEAVDSEDGWSIRTADRAPAVGREGMIAVQSDGFRVLGGPAEDDSGPAAGYNPLRTGPGSGV